MSAPVILLYGYGHNVGVSTLKKFAAKGWQTAAIVRTLRDEYKDGADVVLKADFSDRDAIQKVYDEVESKLGTPNVVVYNAYNNSNMETEPFTPFGAPPDQIAFDFAVNTMSMYAAAYAAEQGFKKLQSGPKVFLYTSNPFATQPIVELPGLGGGKAASNYIIETAAFSLGRKLSSFWYSVDERSRYGISVMRDIHGDAHAEVFWELANRKEQGPWNHTFVKGTGYVKFDDVVDHEIFARAQMRELAASIELNEERKARRAQQSAE